MTLSVTWNVTSWVVPLGAGLIAGSYGFQSVAGVALKSIVASSGFDPLPLPDDVPPPAASVPATLMASSIPASLWPATVHHAWVDSSNGPTVIVLLAPGCNMPVPSDPSSCRSCSSRPPLCTLSAISSPLGTVMALGDIEMSASSTSASVTVGAAAVVAALPDAE